MATDFIQDLGLLFFGENRRRVLGLLLLHPEESFHLREIARIVKVQPGTLRRELAILVENGVLERKKIGNQVHYRANRDCPVYEELRGMLRKTSGVADVLREALASLSERISVAFVYGSVARGAERRASDVDVMVVGEVTFEEVVQALHPCQESLRREINPNVYSRVDFKKKVRERGAFISRVLASPKLFLIGAEHDLAKSGSNRKAESAYRHAGRGD